MAVHVPCSQKNANTAPLSTTLGVNDGTSYCTEATGPLKEASSILTFRSIVWTRVSGSGSLLSHLTNSKVASRNEVGKVNLIVLASCLRKRMAFAAPGRTDWPPFMQRARRL